MAHRRVLVPFDIKLECEIKAQITESLQTRDFYMHHPQHPSGCSVHDLYVFWIGHTLSSLMGNRYNATTRLPHEDIYELESTLREYESAVYGVMPSPQLHYELALATRDGFKVDVLSPGTILFTIHHDEPQALPRALQFNWRHVSGVRK